MSIPPPARPTGARHIRRHLRRQGIAAACCTVERLMREAGLEGVSASGRTRRCVPREGVHPVLPGRHQSADGRCLHTHRREGQAGRKGPCDRP
ncbi:IS3 family transposase [Streptomyces decoyicus]|uniref:IS3 family transposase n=1 Tax=Streptomyces decoyicus TaxID=249567 RepID=UPI003663C382